jgi:hypothetical protein
MRALPQWDLAAMRYRKGSTPFSPALAQERRSAKSRCSINAARARPPGLLPARGWINAQAMFDFAFFVPLVEVLRIGAGFLLALAATQ